jgi:hypothetical protein
LDTLFALSNFLMIRAKLQGAQGSVRLQARQVVVPMANAASRGSKIISQLDAMRDIKA